MNKIIREIEKAVNAEGLKMVGTHSSKNSIRITAEDDFGNQGDFTFSNSSSADPLNDSKSRAQLRRWKREMKNKRPGAVGNGAVAQALHAAVKKTPDSVPVKAVVQTVRGVEIDTYCEDGNMMATVADGKGGSTVVIKYINSPDCVAQAESVKTDVLKVDEGASVELVKAFSESVKRLTKSASKCMLEVVKFHLTKDGEATFFAQYPKFSVQKKFSFVQKVDGTGSVKAAQKMHDWHEYIDLKSKPDVMRFLTPKNDKDRQALVDILAEFDAVRPGIHDTFENDEERDVVQELLMRSMFFPEDTEFTENDAAYYWKQLDFNRTAFRRSLDLHDKQRKHEEEQRKKREATALARREAAHKKANETRELLESSRKKREEELAALAPAPVATITTRKTIEEEDMGVPKHVRDFERMVRDEGLVIHGKGVDGNNHHRYDIGYEKGPVKRFVVGSSPSDRNVHRIERGNVRRWRRELDVMARTPQEPAAIIIAPTPQAAAIFHPVPPAPPATQEPIADPVVTTPPAPVEPPAPTPTPAPATRTPGRGNNEYKEAFQMLKADLGVTDARYHPSTTNLLKVRNWMVDNVELLTNGTPVSDLGIRMMLELQIPVAYDRLLSMVKVWREEAARGPLLKVDIPAETPAPVQKSEQQLSLVEAHAAPAAVLQPPTATLPPAPVPEETFHISAFERVAPINETAPQVETPYGPVPALAPSQPADTEDKRIEALEEQVRLLTRVVRTLARLEGVDLPQKLQFLVKDL